ncbi:TPA: helix-turn-helix domain-containing protein [Raoultella planticola]|uniref:helix-turn-helix domain-containing protein n=1 Tax=Raoultella ornithinolytica TaxID=54291 RepID=UPI000FEC0FC8|nr:helix-turn-helix transcriptional regulator [Raoultella ornithinolytica]RWT94220.1 transcriptional regulator [Raoultella ornithinolytica]
MNNIATERQKLGISQAQLAKALNWGRSRLSNYEANLREPGLTECRLIVDVLNELGASCSLDSVFPTECENQVRS